LYSCSAIFICTSCSELRSQFRFKRSSLQLSIERFHCTSYGPSAPRSARTARLGTAGRLRRPAWRSAYLPPCCEPLLPSVSSIFPSSIWITWLSLAATSVPASPWLVGSIVSPLASSSGFCFTNQTLLLLKCARNSVLYPPYRK
jgi:hypothetical protein